MNKTAEQKIIETYTKTAEQKIIETYTKTEVQKIVGCTFATASKWFDKKEFPLYALEKLGVEVKKTFISKVELEIKHIK